MLVERCRHIEVMVKLLNDEKAIVDKVLESVI